MPRAPTPANEKDRLAALLATGLLDTLPEPAYDDVVELASLICGTPMALVSLVDEGRQWLKARIGLDATEIPREISFCAHAILEPDKTFVVNDASHDERFAENPLVTSEPSIRFYAGASLMTSGGQTLGTLCVLDRVPRTLSERQLRALGRLRDQLQAQLELRRRAQQLREQETVIRSQLDELHRLQSLKDELVSLIVHDLRNPLSAVVGFVNLSHDLLQDSGRGDVIEYLAKARESAELMKDRIEGLLEVRLIELGELKLRLASVPLRDLVREAVDRVSAEAGRRMVAIEVGPGDVEIKLDRKLVRHALEALLSNALRHSLQSATIWVSLEVLDEAVAIDVGDQGPGIPDSFKRTFFDKFASVDTEKGVLRRGMGLGLYLVKLVADLHGGATSVRDRAGGGVIFRLQLPTSR